MTERSPDERPPLALEEVARLALELAGERELRALVARFLETAQKWAAPSAIVAAVRQPDSEAGWRLLPALSCGSVPMGIERSLASLVERSPECLGRPTVLRPTEDVPGVKARDNWVVPWSFEGESGLLLLRGVPRPSPSNLGEALAVASAPVWPRLLGGPSARVETLVREIGEAGSRLQAEAERQLQRLQAAAASVVERERSPEPSPEEAELAGRVARLSADLESVGAERLAAAERLLEARRATEVATAEATALKAERDSLKAAMAAAEVRASTAEARAGVAEQQAALARDAVMEGAQIGNALAAEHARERERAELASARADAVEARLRRAEQALASAQAATTAAQQAAQAAEQRALAAEEQAKASGESSAAAQSRLEAAEQAAQALEERARAAEQARSDAAAPIVEQPELVAALAERERALEAAEARARAAEEALVHTQHQRVEALTAVERQSDEAAAEALREAVEARTAAEARALEAEQSLTEARRDFAELRAHSDQAELLARDASARIDSGLAGVREVIASAHRAAFVPAGLRLHLEEVAARVSPQPRPEGAWLKIAILDRDLGGLEPLAASLEALGLDVRVANYPEELALLLRTPAAREIGAAVCDVMAFRPDQNVAGLFRSWDKERPGLPLFLSYDPESPVELERAKRIP
ncbi:MAG TPA: hypothetical protein VEQ10_04205, partial [Vicinamibacteria bacterium]|nr:hypothetical protein [Vicinamibacteria bacterium]